MILLRRPDYLAEYAASRLFLMAAQSLPLPTALRLGEWAGRRMVFWTQDRFQTGVENVLHAYPDKTRPQAEALIRRVYEHFGRAAIEVAFAHRLLHAANYRDFIRVRNEQYLRQVIEGGKGAIFLTAHLGVWEIFGLVLRHWGVQPVSVYRPMKNPLVDRLVRERRSAFGQKLIERKGALPVLLRVLRRGGYIALLADQHARKDGTWVPFFGRPASTTIGPALLALRTGAPILMGYGRRLPGLYQFEAVLDEPIYATPTGDRTADVERVTAEIARRTEGYIRRHPDQWLWMHRRWRTPPPELAAKGQPDVEPSGKVD